MSDTTDAASDLSDPQPVGETGPVTDIEPVGEPVAAATSTTDHDPATGPTADATAATAAPAEDETVVDSTVDDEHDAPLAAAPGAPRRSLVVLTILAVVTALALLATTVALAASRSHLQHQRDDQRAAAAVAGRFGARFLTYDYTHLDQLKQSVLGLLAGHFKDSYQSEFGAFEQLATTARSRSVATVKHVYVEDVANDQTTAVVVIDRTVDGVSGRRVYSDVFAQLDLVKVKGQWLVDNYLTLSAGETLGGGSSTPSAPTTTAIPAPPK